MKPAPIGGLRAPEAPKLPDETSERARRALHEAIVAMQQLPASSLRVLEDVQLKDGVATPIRHGLGRKPYLIWPSVPRGASSTGRIDDVLASPYDGTQVIVLKASGFGATITVNIGVL